LYEKKIYVQYFLPHDAMLARHMLWPCVRLCLSVSLLYSVILKRLNIGSRKQNHTIAPGLKFSDAKDLREIPVRSPPAGVPNAGGVC